MQICHRHIGTDLSNAIVIDVIQVGQFKEVLMELAVVVNDFQIAQKFVDVGPSLHF